MQLLLPVVSLADTQPALTLFKAGNCGKKKTKLTVTLRLTHDCVAVTSKKDCGLEMCYENIDSVYVTDKKRHVAIKVRKEDGKFLLVCLDLKIIQGRFPFSMRRKCITVSELILDTL